MEIAYYTNMIVLTGISSKVNIKLLYAQIVQTLFQSTFTRQWFHSKKSYNSNFSHLGISFKTVRSEKGTSSILKLSFSELKYYSKVNIYYFLISTVLFKTAVSSVSYKFKLPYNFIWVLTYII